MTIKVIHSHTGWVFGLMSTIVLFSCGEVGRSQDASVPDGLADQGTPDLVKVDQAVLDITSKDVVSGDIKIVDSKYSDVPRIDLMAPDLVPYIDAPPKDVNPPDNKVLSDVKTIDLSKPDVAGKYCGDKVKNGVEDCDNTDLGLETCQTQGYYKGILKCTSGCKYDFGGCDNCGNGKQDTGEKCDGSQLGNGTCKGMGFDGGTLKCKSDCTYDDAPCYKVLDPNGIVISSANGTQYLPDVAYSGSDYMVVWSDDQTTSTMVFGTKVTTSGGVQIPNGKALSTSTKSYNSAIAFDGKNYLVAWQQNKSSTSNELDIYASHIDTSGQPLSGLAVSTEVKGQMGPVLAFGNGKYLLVWVDERNTTSGIEYDIYGARVSSAGSLLDPAGIMISSATGLQSDPDVVFDGTNFFVVWEDERNGTTDNDIYGARVSSSGIVLDANGLSLVKKVGHQVKPAIGCDTTNCLVAFMDAPTAGVFDVHGFLMTKSGAVVTPGVFTISSAKNSQYNPRVEFDGSNYLVVWMDDRKVLQKYEIYASRILPSGTVMDPSGILIFSGKTTSYFPKIAFDGTNYLIVWREFGVVGGTNSDIYATRFNP